MLCRVSIDFVFPWARCVLRTAALAGTQRRLILDFLLALANPQDLKPAVVNECFLGFSGGQLPWLFIGTATAAVHPYLALSDNPFAVQAANLNFATSVPGQKSGSLKHRMS